MSRLHGELQTMQADFRAHQERRTLDEANDRLANALADGAPALEVSKLEAIRNRLGAHFANGGR